MRAAQQAVRDAERRFPVRVRIAVPPEGFGSRLDQIIAWLDANCGSDRWASTPSSTRGVVKDALAIYFADQGVHGRWCAAQRIEIEDAVYWVYDDGCHGSERACTRRLERACNGRRCSLIPRAGLRVADRK
jgi:hypothetical protein